MPVSVRRAIVGLLFAVALVLSTVAAPGSASASTSRHVSIRTTTVFAPPDYQPSELAFRARGAVRATGTWDFPEGTDEGDVSVVDLTFRPSGTRDYFVIQVRARRVVDVFDDKACTGYAREVGTWTYRYGVGRYASLRGTGKLSAKISYFGHGDPAQGCAGLSERSSGHLVGTLARH